MEVEPLWTPGPQRIAATQIERFRQQRWPSAADSTQLWQASIDAPGPFWRSVWEWCEIVGDPGGRDFDPGESFRSATFLPDATLNMAENLLTDRSGASGDAIIALSENPDPTLPPITEFWSWDRLRAETAAVAEALMAAGVTAGDRVAAWMPHRPETVVAFLASAAIGAVFTSTSSDFGADGVVDRFGQTEPTVLVAATGYRYGGRYFDLSDRLVDIVERLPTVETVIVVDGTGADQTPPTIGARTVVGWSQIQAEHRGVPLVFTPVGFNHPLYILYSSGTTGKPKCIVHRTGGVLLKHLSELRLHCDVRAGDRVFYFTTCGWMMWNWQVSALACGATIVTYDGNPAYPGPELLFEAAAQHGFTLFGISAKFVDSVMKSGYVPNREVALSELRTICSTGSPLTHEGFSWIYRAVASDVHLASISGGTDLCGCLVLGDPTKPVYPGEIQTPALGLNSTVFTNEGTPAPVGEKGELVCTNPFPSTPLEFWGPDGDERYQAAYFDRFADSPQRDSWPYGAVWAHGDFAARTDHGGIIIFGRSDATLNASGVRIGTAEIYRIVEQLDEVVESVAIAQEWDGDTRIVLFVRLADGVSLSDDLVATIGRDLRTKGSPRHVPAVVVAVDDIPRTRSGKITELAVADVVHGRPVQNTEALANPEALRGFADLPQLEV